MKNVKKISAAFLPLPALRGQKVLKEGDIKMNVNERDLLTVYSLRKDARMRLTDVGRAIRVPVSTIFDRIRTYEGNGLVRKYASLVRFDRLGFHAQALIVFSANKKEREKLFQFLNRHGR